MAEQWKKIYGYPNYNLYFDLYKNGQRTGKRVHVLVADAFLQKPSGNVTVDHKDRNRHNNRLSNLRYSTISEQNKNRESWAKG